MKVLLTALRPETLFGSTFVYLVAAALAWLHTGQMDPALGAFSFAALVLLHLSLNLLFHAVNPGPGLDSPQPPQEETEEQDEDKEEKASGRRFLWWIVILSALILFLAGLGLGLWLAEQDRPFVLLWGFGGVAAGLGYILGPPRLRRLGPGQVVVFLGFGPLLTMGTYYALTGRMTLGSALIGLPQTLLLVAVLWADPVLFRKWDQTAGQEASDPDPHGQTRITLWAHLGLVVLGLAALGLLVQGAGAGPLALLGLAMAPLGLSAALELRKKNLTPESVKRARKKTIISYLALAMLLIAGLVGESFLRS